MSERMEWKEFPSNYDSKCQKCGKCIKQGDPIMGRKSPHGKWEIICLGCAPETKETDPAEEAEAELNYKDLKAEFERMGDEPDEPAKPARVKKDSLEYFRQNATWGL